MSLEAGIIITLLLSAFFSGIEIAFISSDKLTIHVKKKKGVLGAILLSRFLNKPSLFISTTLIGNNIALVIYTILMARLIEPILIQRLPISIQSDWLILISQTLISTMVILIIGEFVPKILFRFKANEVLNIASFPFTAIYYLLLPLTKPIVYLSKVLINLVQHQKLEETSPVFSILDLQSLVEDQANEKSSDFDQNLFDNAIELGNAKVRDCMIPRTEIEAIDVSETVKELEKKIIQTKLSKIIVYHENIDNVLGYVHHFDLWKDPSKIKSTIMEIPVVPEAMSAKELLDLFIQRRKSIALVVDEFGGTAGIVTLEDILEEIFGEIEDEHDLQDFIERKINKNEFIFSARMEVDYLNDKYKLNIPDGEYETLSGYIINSHENIPKLNETILLDHFEFKVLSVSNTKIESLQVKILQ